MHAGRAGLPLVVHGGICERIRLVRFIKSLNIRLYLSDKVGVVAWIFVHTHCSPML